MDLRPKTFDGIIGQTNVKECLQIAIKSAKNRGDVLGHTLLCGPPGLGKTTVSLATAHEMGSKIFLANGGNVKNIKHVLPYLYRLKRGDILFIDEIHSVHKRVQEALFTVLEDFRLDLSRGALSKQFEPFTIIGATTEAGMLLRPFYDRFLHQFTLELYTVDELSSIIQNNCGRLKVNATDEAISSIANRSKFTPRIANSLLLWCRDFANAQKSSVIDEEVVDAAMELKQVDSLGLTNEDRLYIDTIRKAGKPLGLSTLVAITGSSRETIEHQIEPYLFKIGLIEKSSRGRSLL